jgi:hydroxyethylthiazole kinase-like uncharacterized protein yjeF
MKYVSVAEMQAIEQEANANGLSYADMMENAGRGLAEVILDFYAYLVEDGALGLVGSGNNGGDTLVALAYLAKEGWKTGAAILRPRPDDDPLVARLQASGGAIYDLSGKPAGTDLDLLGELLHGHALLLDGVLGTGIRLPLKGELAQALDFVRRTIASMPDPPVVVAVDCPSGIDCDSGEAALECIPAERTVTMAAIKQGLFKFPAYKLVGDLHVVGIGLPGEGEKMDAWRNVHCFVPDAEWVRLALPQRALDAHKGTFGTALIVAGSASYTGAALLAGKAAYRCGAGLVTLAVPTPVHAALAGQLPDATWLLLPHQDGFIAAEAGELVLKALEHATALLVGPGFGLEETTGEFVARLLKGEAFTKIMNASPLQGVVFDADGLKLLKQVPKWWKRLPVPAVLTPHPGEMSVLTGLTKDEIQADRLGMARHFSHEWGHVVILKGAFSVIAAPDGEAAVIPVATPALARAGTGDVLAGLVTGLRAQGMAAFQAAVAAAWIHAQAGLAAAATLGSTAPVMASDVLQAVPQIIADIQ